MTRKILCCQLFCCEWSQATFESDKTFGSHGHDNGTDQRVFISMNQQKGWDHSYEASTLLKSRLNMIICSKHFLHVFRESFVLLSSSIRPVKSRASQSSHSSSSSYSEVRFWYALTIVILRWMIAPHRYKAHKVTWSPNFSNLRPLRPRHHCDSVRDDRRKPPGEFSILIWGVWSRVSFQSK